MCAQLCVLTTQREQTSVSGKRFHTAYHPASAYQACCHLQTQRCPCSTLSCTSGTHSPTRARPLAFRGGTAHAPLTPAPHIAPQRRAQPARSTAQPQGALNEQPQVAQRSRQPQHKMRIALLHPDLGLGGAERLIVDAAAELVRLGHTVDVYTAYYDPNRCFEETKTAGFAVKVAGGWFPRHILGRFIAFCAYIRCILAAIYIARVSRKPGVGLLHEAACLYLRKPGHTHSVTHTTLRNRPCTPDHTKMALKGGRSKASRG